MSLWQAIDSIQNQIVGLKNYSICEKIKNKKAVLNRFY